MRSQHDLTSQHIWLVSIEVWQAIIIIWQVMAEILHHTIKLFLSKDIQMSSLSCSYWFIFHEQMKAINSLPPMEHMTREMLQYYFPEASNNDEKSPMSEGRYHGIRWFPGYSYGFDRYPKWQLGNRFNNEWEFFPPKEISQRWENLNLQFKREEQFLAEDPAEK